MLTSSIALCLGIPLLLGALLWRLWQIKREFSHFNHLPAYSTLLSPVYPLGRILPRIPWVAAGSTFAWKDAYECRSPIIVLLGPAPDLGPTAMFGKVGSDIVVLRSLSPLPRPYLLIADATALKVQRFSVSRSCLRNHSPAIQLTGNISRPRCLPQAHAQYPIW